MKIKVSEASGPVLDWMVAYASGAMLNDPELKIATNFLEHQERYPKHCYQRYWAQGGPIIEREEIGIRRNAPCSKGCEWQGSPSITAKGAGGKWGYGPTPLIAAMRCFVASKLGDEVDVPDELL